MSAEAAIDWVVARYRANFDANTEVRTIVGHPMEGTFPLPGLVTFVRIGNITKPYPGKLHDRATLVTEFHYARANMKVAADKVTEVRQKVAQILMSDHTLGANVLVADDLEYTAVRFQLADNTVNQGILFELPILDEFASAIS